MNTRCSPTSAQSFYRQPINSRPDPYFFSATTISIHLTSTAVISLISKALAFALLQVHRPQSCTQLLINRPSPVFSLKSLLCGGFLIPIICIPGLGPQVAARLDPYADRRREELKRSRRGDIISLEGLSVLLTKACTQVRSARVVLVVSEHRHFD